MGTLTKDATEIKDMLNPQVTVERGSSVGSDVYKECLASTHYPFVENDDYLLAWTKEKLSSFKVAAIPILVGMIPDVIVVTNDKSKSEVQHIQPLLKTLLDCMVAIAFPAAQEAFEVTCKDYFGIHFPMPSGKTYSINLRTDLSIILTTAGVGLGGFENKIASENFRSRASKAMLATGEKALGQCCAQISGAVEVLKLRGITATNCSQIVTNGRTFAYVERVHENENNRQPSFRHYSPIDLSLSSRDKSQPFAAKPTDDEAFRHVAHILGLMFDNISYLAHLVETTPIRAPMRRLPTHHEIWWQWE